MKSGGGATLGRSGWVEDIDRIDRAGVVHVRLRDGNRSVTLQVSAPGTHAQKLVRTRFGDVSYTEMLGLSEAAAVKTARAYAARLDRGAARLPAFLPHLAVAAAAGRSPGSCRPAVAALWPRDGALPAARDELRLDTDGLREFFAPEIGVDAAPFAGFVLRSVNLEDGGAGTSTSCILEFGPAASGQPPEAVSIALGSSWIEDQSFGAKQTLSLTIRACRTDAGGGIPHEVAHLCSLLTALIELKQSAAFAVRPARPGTVALPSVSSSGGVLPAHAVALPRQDTEAHRFAILSSGYTIIRQVLTRNEVDDLATAAERALEAMRAAVATGRDLAYTFYDKDIYLGTRCIYCWGEGALRLIEHDLVRRIAEAVIGPHKLFDMSGHRALPAASFGPNRTEEWHRDIDVFDDSPQAVRYLWFFVPLDDFTADNGATWIVPGSQRLPNAAVPRNGSGIERFPTRVQLVGRAGDIFVINPSALHSVGHNTTAQPRTLINLGVCHASIRPLLDHWAIAGPAIQAQASDRLFHMLGAIGEPPPDTTWSVLPEGWKTERRSAETDPATRVFPPEQQGYQRSHRRREPR